jgi:hypothetical protein
MSYVCVENQTGLWVPGPQLKPRERAELSGFERRQHLEVPGSFKRNGATFTLDPLDEDERGRMEALLMARQSHVLPHVGDMEYRFAPNGERGSAWVMPDGHWRIISRTHGKMLRALREGERPKVRAVMHKNVPSPFLWTFGAHSAEELAYQPDPYAATLSTDGVMVRDGAVSDVGFGISRTRDIGGVRGVAEVDDTEH